MNIFETHIAKEIEKEKSNNLNRASLTIIASLLIKSESYKIGLISKEEYSKFLEDLEHVYATILER